MVYAGLKYLLPLVVPLLLGYTLALLLRPSARFLQHRITVRIFGKKWKPSLGLIGWALFLDRGKMFRSWEAVRPWSRLGNPCGRKYDRSRNKVCEREIGAVLDGWLLLYSRSYRSYWIYKPVFFLQRHFKLTGNGRVKRTVGPVCFQPGVPSDRWQAGKHRESVV